MSQKLKVSSLKEHPKNCVFFDDIQGDAWGDFLESIKTSGVIEPIVVTQDKVIVSGHQRVRACKKLGIAEIEAEVRIFDSDDEILKCLIETNIRQRGIGNPNPVKFGRCIQELERIYGIRNGNNQYAEREVQNAQPSKSQADLAEELGISIDNLKRYKKLASAIPEVQELVETGTITKTIALSMIKKLTEDEQRELAATLPSTGDKTSADEALKKVKAALAEKENRIRELEAGENLPGMREAYYKNRIKTLEAQGDELKKNVVKLEGENWSLEHDLTELRASLPDGDEDPATEAAIKEKALEFLKADLDSMAKKYNGLIDFAEFLTEYAKNISK